MIEAEVEGMWPQAKENLETPDALAGSPLPGRGEGAPPLMSASVRFRTQPSIAEESPRNGVFSGPGNLRLVTRSRLFPPTWPCSSQSDRWKAG